MNVTPNAAPFSRSPSPKLVTPDLPPPLPQLELLDCLHVLLKRLPRLAPSSSSGAAAAAGGAGQGQPQQHQHQQHRRDAAARAYGSLAEFGAARAVWRREAGDIAAAEQLFAAAAAASKRTAEGEPAAPGRSGIGLVPRLLGALSCRARGRVVGVPRRNLKPMHSCLGSPSHAHSFAPSLTRNVRGPAPPKPAPEPRWLAPTPLLK